MIDEVMESAGVLEKRGICHVLANITGGSSEQIQAVIDRMLIVGFFCSLRGVYFCVFSHKDKMIGLIASLLQDEDTDTREAAFAAYAHTSINGTTAQLQAFYDRCGGEIAYLMVRTW